MTDPAPYLTPAEVRQRVGRGGPTLRSEDDDRIAEAVTEFEEITERYRGAARRPRTATQTVTTDCGLIIPEWPQITAVAALSYDQGTAPDPADVVIVEGYGLSLSPWGTCWPCGRRITVTYTHGYAQPEVRLLRATALYAAYVIGSEASGTGRDVLSQAFDGATTRYSTPDWNAGRPTGWLEVDRILNSLPDERSKVA